MWDHPVFSNFRICLLVSYYTKVSDYRRFVFYFVLTLHLSLPDPTPETRSSRFRRGDTSHLPLLVPLGSETPLLPEPHKVSVFLRTSSTLDPLPFPEVNLVFV